MTALLIVAGLTVVIVGGLAMALPCEGCRLRRQRMRKAYEHWRTTRGK